MTEKVKLEEAKRLYQTANADQRYVLERLFPELKESEDEKNVKDLIDELKCSLRAANCQNDACNGGHKKRIALLEWAIAWLEKQVEQTNFPQFTFDDVLALQCCMETVKKVQEDENLYNQLQKLHDRLYDAYQLEKQGNPADKVEPKFKIGDWCIDNEDGVIFQIVKVLDNTYTYKTNEGEEYSCTHYSLENDAKLWTINDAKEGDVLEFGDHGRLVTGILSFVNKTTGKVDASCLLEGDKFKTGIFYNLDTVKPHPATKEQRDTLFQKMRKAGYMWDAESKQILSLKAEPTREIRGNNGKISPKWSKEDEEEFKIAIETLHEAGQHSSAMWLKSIKQRIVQ